MRSAIELSRSQTLFSFGPFRWLIEVLDAIPIERDGLGIGGLKETIRRLRRGEMVLMFPEGTRTRTGELSQLKPGFCALVRRTKVQILPLAMDGAFQVWPKGQPLPKLGTVHLCVGQPITPEQIREWSDEELVAAVSGIEHCLADARASRRTAREGGTDSSTAIRLRGYSHVSAVVDRKASARLAGLPPHKLGGQGRS